MHSDQNNSRGLGRPWLWLALAGFLMPWLWAAGYLVSLPEEVLTTNLLLDDSLYFAVPAQHFWQGHGLSFDGLELTNGVQTLWMLVTLALAYAFTEPTMLLRAMVATSALLWLLACLGLFALLRRRSFAGATLAAVGMAWCGVYGRLAFTGMENGISALAAVLVLLVGARVVSQAWSHRGALMLGLGIAVFALCRTEAVLLGPLVGGALMLGWFGRELPWSSRARLTATLAVPGVILVGGALLFSRLVFDLWLPISGSVKAFYERLWAENPPHGGFVENLLWHVRYVFHLAVAPLRDSVPAELSAWTGLRTRWFRNLIWVWLLGSLVLAGWRWRQARRSRAATASAGLRWSFAQVFAIYACAHLVLMATALPHFTDYGSWYFTPEIVTVWLAVGSLVSIARGRLAAVAIAIAALITIAGAMRTSLIAHDMITSRLRSGGMWLEQHVAPGTTVGACSSGLAAWYAPSLHVVNLDGLINNRRYFEDYLKPARVPDYFVDKDIRWFSDYSSLLGWRAGISWQGLVPAERLVPRCYWRLAGERAHGVWQVLPPGDSFELLGDRTDVARDRYVELAVAADVHGRFPVVRDVDLAAAIAANPELVVARSIPEEPRLDLLHVLATRQQLQEIDLREGSVFPEHVLHTVAAPGLQVLGFDDVRATLGGEQRFAVTIYWLSTTAQRSQDYQLALCIDGKQVAVASVGDCHGTLPMSQWTPTTVVTETVVLTGKELGKAELRLLQDGRTEPVLRLAR